MKYKGEREDDQDDDLAIFGSELNDGAGDPFANFLCILK
jgi:hypothetical protein